jgi:hypothetical protein
MFSQCSLQHQDIPRNSYGGLLTIDSLTGVADARERFRRG